MHHLTPKGYLTVTPKSRITFPKFRKPEETAGDGVYRTTINYEDMQYRAAYLNDAISYQRHAANMHAEAAFWLARATEETSPVFIEVYESRAYNYQRKARYWAQRARDMVRLAAEVGVS